MKINMTNEEIDMLCELVYLGDWIINSYRLIENHIERYSKFVDKIARLHRHILSPEDRQKFDNDSFQFYMDRLEKFIDEYDDESCLTSLAKRLAVANYPINPKSTHYYDGLFIQLDALKIYEKELLEKGMSIIDVDIPDMEDRLEVCRQAFKQNSI